MNLRIASTLAWAFPVEEVIRLVKELKFESISKQIRQVKEEINMQLTMHAASWDLNLSSLNTGIRKQSVQEIIRSIELASQIGADNITFHPGKLTLADSDVSVHADIFSIWNEMPEVNKIHISDATKEILHLPLLFLLWSFPFITNGKWNRLNAGFENAL